jgi:hypothetical protein
MPIVLTGAMTPLGFEMVQARGLIVRSRVGCCYSFDKTSSSFRCPVIGKSTGLKFPTLLAKWYKPDL